MALFSNFKNPLKSSIGNNLDNDPDDILTTKAHLKNLKYMKEDQGIDVPYITAQMNEGVKNFQKDHALRIDGIMKPGGETERRMFEVLENKPAASFWDMDSRTGNAGGFIGFGGNVSGTTLRAENPKPRQDVISEILDQIPPPQPNPRGRKKRGIFNTLEILAKTAEEANKRAQPVVMSLMENDKPQRPAAQDVNKETPVENPKPRPRKNVSHLESDMRLLDVIGGLESSDNYNVIVGGEEKPLTKMTIKEVRQLQEQRTQENLGTAVGRYQIIDDKMDDLVRWMDIDEDAAFDKDMQDKMGKELLKRRGGDKFKNGEISKEEFIENLSKEWASLPKDSSGRSYYEGGGNNKAHIEFEKIKELLEE